MRVCVHLLQVPLRPQGCVHASRAPPNISQRVGRGASSSAWRGSAWQRVPVPRCDGGAGAGPTPLLSTLWGMLQSPLPEEHRPACTFPYQAVRIPFDKMRRYRVLPRGCCWGGEPSPVPWGRKGKDNQRPPAPSSNCHPGQSGRTWMGEGPENGQSFLKAISHNLRGEGSLNFSHNPPKKMIQNINTEFIEAVRGCSH